MTTTTATAETREVVKDVFELGFPWQTIDPFLFCVHHDDAYPTGNRFMGPKASLAGRNIGQDFSYKDGWSMYHGDVVPGFPQHPHRGFETLTVVRRGLVDHSDSLGATARYGRGDAQWMTAGEGIVHSEMFPLLDESGDNPLELFQIWINLPQKHKLVKPHFTMLWGEDLPRFTSKDANGKTTDLVAVAGAYGGKTPPSPPPKSWASDPGAEVAVWTLKLEPGAVFTLPAGKAGLNRVLYFFAGDGMEIGGRSVMVKSGVHLESDLDVTLVAGAETCELLMLQGRPIAEPVVQYGPFVMNTQQEIQQAFMDYRRSGFGGWPWPSNEPVHERTAGRFAKHADGRLDKPKV